SRREHTAPRVRVVAGEHGVDDRHASSHEVHASAGERTVVAIELTITKPSGAPFVPYASSALVGCSSGFVLDEPHIDERRCTASAIVNSASGRRGGVTLQCRP